MIYDRSYFVRRAEQERKAAASALNANAQRVHLELAKRYEGLSGEPAAREAEPPAL
jgi:hypothetical protein